MYAKIIIDITHEKLDRTFEYEVPKDMEDGLAIGSSVLVPFGNQDRLRQGFVVGFAKECSFDPEKIKAIHGKAPKSVSIEENLVSLAVWMKEHYGGTMIQASEEGGAAQGEADDSQDGFCGGGKKVAVFLPKEEPESKGKASGSAFEERGCRLWMDYEKAWRNSSGRTCPGRKEDPYSGAGNGIS